MSDLPRFPVSPEGGDGISVVPLDQPLRGADFGQAFLRFWKKYAVFSGRASRSEFWWWALASFLIGIVLSVVDAALGDNRALEGLFDLATIVPSFALSFRRLHDTNRSGWWLLLILLPIIGWIVLLVFYIQPPKPEGVRFDKR